MTTQAAGQGPEPDVDVDDGDSALGDDSGSLKTSVASSVYEYRKEHNRTYHSYRDGSYPFPNDETELDRLDLQHLLFANIQDEKLFLAPLDNPKQVLDIGTGTGIWAIEFADRHPDASIIGTDLSPTQTQWVPPNLEFQVDDANDDWTYKQKFDFIHVREMQMAVGEKKLFKQAFDALQPGGWFEIKGGTLPLICDDGTFDNTSLKEWSDGMVEIFRKMGRPFDNPYQYKQWLEDAGFVNVTERGIPVPVNTWPKDKKLKRIGQWQCYNLLQGLQGFTVKLFVQFLDYSEEQVEVFLTQVRKDLQDTRIHAYLRVFAFTAQKPGGSEGATAS